MRLGGLGMRSATEVVPSAHLSSLHATFALVQTILPVHLSFCKAASLDDALSS